MSKPEKKPQRIKASRMCKAALVSAMSHVRCNNFVCLFVYFTASRRRSEQFAGERADDAQLVVRQVGVDGHPETVGGRLVAVDVGRRGAAPARPPAQRRRRDQRRAQVQPLQVGPLVRTIHNKAFPIGGSRPHGWTVTSPGFTTHTSMGVIFRGSVAKTKSEKGFPIGGS